MKDIIYIGELYHFGIKGQKWGVRNGPPYPLNEDDKSAKEKAEEKKSIDWKKVGKATAITLGVALAAYGGYKIGTNNREIRQAILSGKNKIKSLAGIPIPPQHKEVGKPTNPNGYRTNCKDCAEALIKRWVGVDSEAIAGPKTVSGKLKEFVDQRKYNPKGVTWINKDGAIIAKGDSSDLKRTSDAILHKFNDGDCGMVGLTWNPDKFKEPIFTGHAFNWFIENGNVHYIDTQRRNNQDAGSYLMAAKSGEEIQIVRLTKTAFNR